MSRKASASKTTNNCFTTEIPNSISIKKEKFKAKDFRFCKLNQTTIIRELEVYKTSSKIKIK